MAVVLDEESLAVLDETGVDVLDEFGGGPTPFPIKNPTYWIPQPIGYGYITAIAQSQIVDQHANFIVDQLGNFISTGTQHVQIGRTPTAWGRTGA